MVFIVLILMPLVCAFVSPSPSFMPAATLLVLNLFCSYLPQNVEKGLRARLENVVNEPFQVRANKLPRVRISVESSY